MPVLSLLMQEHEIFSHLLGILKNFLYRGILVYRDEDLCLLLNFFLMCVVLFDALINRWFSG